MTSQKHKKFISLLIVLTMVLALLPASLGLAASYTNVEDFVKNLYVAGLGRQPDIAGYNYWVDQLKNGRSAAEAIGYVLLDSPEFKEKYANISNEEFVKKAYEIVFNRAADESGLEFWVDAMVRGGSQRYVIVAMLYAPTGEFQEFCDKVGIKLGTIEVPPEEFPSEKPAKLEVEEVSAINLKQIVVKFNSSKLLDEDTVEDEDNYEFEGILPDEDDEEEIEILSAEVVGNTAIITLKNAVANQSKGTLTMSDAILGEEYKEEIEFFDIKIPEVLDAEVVGSDTIKVYFSEPINFGELDDKGLVTDSRIEEAFELDGGDFFVRSVKPNQSGTEANVRFYTDFEEGTYTFAVLNKIEDYAGFTLIGKEFKVKVVPDKQPPQLIGYKDAKAREITLIFDEDIQPADGAAELDVNAFYHTNSKNPAKTAEIINGNEIKLTFDEEYELPNGYAYIYIDKDTIEDLWENANPTSLWIRAEIDYDVDAPEVEKVEMKEQNVIKVTFNEDVEDDSAEDEDNYKVVNQDGDEVDIDDVDRDREKLNIVYIELDEEIYGKCTLTIEGVEDLYKNAMKKTTITFEAEDKTPPKFEDFTATLYDVDEDIYTIVVDFGEKMAVSGKYSVVDLEKYKIDNVYLDEIDKDYISIRAIDNNKKVEIEIEKDNDKDLEIIAGESKLVIARVADAAGNYTKELASGEITIEDGINEPLAVKNIKAVANDKIQITLEGKAVDFKADDFIVYYEDEEGNKKPLRTVGAKINNSGDNSVITITLDDDENVLNDNAKYGGKDVYVKTQDYDDVDTENEYGQKLILKDKDELSDSNVVRVKDGIQPKLAKVTINSDGVIDPNGDKKVDRVEVDVANKIVELHFTEDIMSDTVSKVTFVVEDMSVTKAWAEGNVIYLQVWPKRDKDGNLLELKRGLKVTQRAVIWDKGWNAISNISTEINVIKTEASEEPGDSDDESPGDESKFVAMITSFEEGDDIEPTLSLVTENPPSASFEYVQDEGVTDGDRAVKVTINSLNKVEPGPFSELVIDNGNGWDFGDGIFKVDVTNPEDYAQQIRVMIKDEAGTVGTYYFSFEPNQSRTLEITQFDQHDNVFGNDGYWGLSEKGLDKANIKSISICVYEFHSSLRDDSVNTTSFIVDNIRVVGEDEWDINKPGDSSGSDDPDESGDSEETGTEPGDSGGTGTEPGDSGETGTEPGGSNDESPGDGSEFVALITSFEEGESILPTLIDPDNRGELEYPVKEGVTDGNRAVRVKVNPVTKNWGDPTLVINSGSDKWDLSGDLLLDITNPENFIQDIRIRLTDEDNVEKTFRFVLSANETRTVKISEATGSWISQDPLKKGVLNITAIKEIKIFAFEQDLDESITSLSFIIDNVRSEK